MPKAFSIALDDLVATDISAWPKELNSSKHLILSSPQALSFNSPGAEGFGVKRASLSLPNSVMLLFSP
ncbi:MAG: hypothetical protein IJS50_04170, partial [Desulfovibrio sp.]|nr:hypothetical protein [Desulfovibrio sp.]